MLEGSPRPFAVAFLLFLVVGGQIAGPEKRDSALPIGLSPSQRLRAFRVSAAGRFPHESGARWHQESSGVG
ncbi:hypothetical protein NDU88_006873 [Pleurodeles waltl]|uniref:Uncharacterized protein n=1 Tax=Pleurodeles waltl TaxID=8319 RepID=A0AAV7WGW5_PLEWA|nr:hypothetical protein NDU88_006873 [Pleurodeles waltl]